MATNTHTLLLCYEDRIEFIIGNFSPKDDFEIEFGVKIYGLLLMHNFLCDLSFLDKFLR